MDDVATTRRIRVAACVMGWLFASLRGFQRSWLRGDLVAGVTVWAVLVPEALAYASIRRGLSGRRSLRRAGGADLLRGFISKPVLK